MMQKKVLLITTSRPEAGSGTGERTLSILNAIATVAEPHVLFLDRAPDARAQTHSATTMTVPLFHGVEQTPWFWRRRKYGLHDFRVDTRLHEVVRQLDQRHRFDAFCCRYLTSAVVGCDRLGPSILDFDDVPAVLPGPRLPGWGLLGWQLVRSRLRTFNTVLVTKQADCQRFGHPDVRVLPCISTRVPLAAASAAGAPAALNGRPPRLLFVGSMRWAPNRSGLMHFVDACLPAIRRDLPGAELRVVGEDSDQLPPIPGLSGAGFVDDLVAEYERADVVIVPMQMGDGANVKLAEAAGFGKAIVASGHAAAGFKGILDPGVDLWVANSDAEMASMCIRLLQDDALRHALASRALLAARQGLSQQAIDTVVSKAVIDAWSERDQGPSPA